VLARPHALAGDDGGEGILALPPRGRSERGALLGRMQAMSSTLAPAPERAGDDGRDALTYVLNPAAVMSSGKTLAQIAHAAVLAADTGELDSWVAEGCPARVLAPGAQTFAALRDASGLAARVVDAGLTEIAPGTVTVVALPPAPASELPAALRG
jgi:peptidyl-tRNA hydrolase